MAQHRRFWFPAAAGFLGGVLGCTGADNPQIPQVAPPAPVSPEQANANAPKKKYMENDRYKQAMEKMQKAQQQQP